MGKNRGKKRKGGGGKGGRDSEDQWDPKRAPSAEVLARQALCEQRFDAYYEAQLGAALGAEDWAAAREALRLIRRGSLSLDRVRSARVERQLSALKTTRRPLPATFRITAEGPLAARVERELGELV